jgi:hypothetical protein
MSPRRKELNPGDPARALPSGASCSASCQHAKRCRAELGIKGNEAECARTPSEYSPNVALTREPDEADEVLPGGSVVESCSRCARRRAGICRDCPQKVHGAIGKALRCEACNRRTRRANEKKHRSDPDVRRRLNAKARRRRIEDPSYAERRRAGSRTWTQKNPERKRLLNRRLLLSEGPSRERYLKTQRRHNANPKRQAKKRAHALARYYELHPTRPDPHCAGCRGRLAWGGTGKPPKWCDDCCRPAEKSRRRKLGHSITVVLEGAA